MFRFSVILAILLAMAPRAAAENHPRAALPFLQSPEKPTSQQEAEAKRVALQFQLRRDDFFARDRSSFERQDRVLFVTPAEQGRVDKRFDRPKVLFGVVVRF